jgi:NADH-quinone oxidoreductase subunit J
MNMTPYGIIFYLLALVLIASTAMAISRTRLVHAVVYLIISFFATALLFYLLGAPFLAALEVIIYAGAIMVIFLFMIMTLSMEEGDRERQEGSFLRPWVSAVVLSTVSLVLLAVLMWAGPDHRLPLKPAMAPPLEFGAYIFRELWFPVEVVSLLLFVALVGALYLGRKKGLEKNADSAREAS